MLIDVLLYLGFFMLFTVSYDVNKDGTKVAVLTFTKSAYRLGETVLGVVELNWRPSRARVLKVGACILHCGYPLTISHVALAIGAAGSP